MSEAVSAGAAAASVAAVVVSAREEAQREVVRHLGVAVAGETRRHQHLQAAAVAAVGAAREEPKVRRSRPAEARPEMPPLPDASVEVSARVQLAVASAAVTEAQAQARARPRAGASATQQEEVAVEGVSARAQLQQVSAQTTTPVLKASTRQWFPTATLAPPIPTVATSSAYALLPPLFLPWHLHFDFRPEHFDFQRVQLSRLGQLSAAPAAAAVGVAAAQAMPIFVRRRCRHQLQSPLYPTFSSPRH